MSRADALSRYRDKRNFDITPEPAADTAVEAQAPRSAARFVIQKHWATRLHYDFRIEIEGTMKSWAVPKGPSLDPSVKRMAVHVEDHPIVYNDFEGTIPKGQYGAGKVIIWDRGQWKTDGDPVDAYRSGKLKIELLGAKLRGRWTLVRTKDETWLLIKERDAHAVPESEFDVTLALPDSVATGAGTMGRDKKRRARNTGKSVPAPAVMPETLEPQLAVRVSAAPIVGDWTYELKYDGYRILTRIETGRARLHTRQGHDWTHRLPGLAHALDSARLPDGWYDGEIVVLDDDGRPDFQALQNALETGASPLSPSAARRRKRTAASNSKSNIVYFLFDLAWIEHEDLRAQPLQLRRERLEAILRNVDQPSLRMSPAFEVAARDMLRSACQLGLEGVIGKRSSSPYVAGRSGHWIKLKCGERQEFVIGGYTDPKGGRIGLGALMLGYYDDEGGLRYAGNVGSGFSDEVLTMLHRRLRRLHQKDSPFTDAPRSAAAHWVRPELAAEVSFSQWTGTGRVRHAVFQGLREDKPVATMKKEEARTISNPDRVVDARSGTRKGDVAAYYERIASLIMAHLKDRPVSLLRAPDGISGELFFQKHIDASRLSGLMQLDPALDPGHDPLVVVRNGAGLAEAAQLNVIEFHTWNAVRTRIDRPDRISFDLDPGEGVKWLAMQEAAVLLRNFLDELGLPSFVKTSGGKGLHVVVPIIRRYDWDTVKGFSRDVVQHMAGVLPKRFSAKSGPRNRVGKIFIDYLRNGFGATTVAAWSLRARPGMGVSVPIRWDEVESIEAGDHWSIVNIDERLEIGNQPWSDYEKSAVALGPAMKRLA